MLPALIGSYLTATCPPPLIPLAGAPKPSACSRGYLRAVPRLVARRCSGPAEAVHTAATEEEDDEGEAEVFDEGFPSWEGGSGEEDYDHDPEIGDIMGDYFDDPNKAQTRALRSWHIVGRLGGCNSMNMQLSQLPLDCKRPSYDSLEGANITPTSFYNIGDLEIQDNLARVWVDIGIHEPLLLDILLNALTTISSDTLQPLSEQKKRKKNLTSPEKNSLEITTVSTMPYPGLTTFLVQVLLRGLQPCRRRTHRGCRIFRGRYGLHFRGPFRNNYFHHYGGRRHGRGGGHRIFGCLRGRRAPNHRHGFGVQHQNHTGGDPGTGPSTRRAPWCPVHGHGMDLGAHWFPSTL
ncbi:hypothetical protein PR202_ga10769 [Eleusine coracana subsp. coracana]|uniref:Uncharacterized protein n=1 Tax=Eleusine coracana subsp. coracana TaxID=191504 RepID=A0AAV5C7H6_ELECO|nr:hypothetical protein PR202_ga10769 [Eleusine coracana subsp. coracana]